MKIAVVAPTYLPARRANTIQVMKMSQALVALGHTVQLCAPGAPPVPWDELAEQYGLSQQFPVSWLAARPQLRRYDYGFVAVRWARGWSADLIYTRLPQTAAIASLQGMPVIFEVHDLPLGLLSPWLLRIFLRGRGAKRLVVITRTLAEDLAGKYHLPGEQTFMLIAPDGVDLKRYSQLPERIAARRELRAKYALPLQENGFIAGYTGHLYAGRGIRLLIDIASKSPETTFLLVGGEPTAVAHLEQAVKSQRLDNVILADFVPNAKVPLFQAACDVLLMPYQRHVAASSGGDIARYLSPMKLFEYLAAQRPIMSSDLPVLREVLNPSNALLLPPGDVQAWVAALQKLRADPERCAALAHNARSQVVEYSWETRARRILEGV